jgi:hypothetical protein
MKCQIRMRQSKFNSQTAGTILYEISIKREVNILILGMSNEQKIRSKNKSNVGDTPFRALWLVT